MTLVWRPGFAYDTDASNYIDAVEIADGQALETATRYAINDFVIGCKQDRIWSAIKASCILAGARTLNGALVPLVGSAPTGSNLVSGDYNRKTGIKGNSSNKSINTNYAIPYSDQDNVHGAAWCSEAMSTLNNILFGNSEGSGLGAYPSNANRYIIACNTSAVGNVDLTGIGNTIGIISVNRAGSTSYTYQIGSSAGSFSATSVAPLAATQRILISANNTYPSNARVAFYSFGQSLNLSSLNSRVTALITAIGAAIP